MKLLLGKFKNSLLHFSLYTKTQHETSMLEIIEKDENPSHSTRMIQTAYDRGTKCLIAHLFLSLILPLPGIISLITSAIRADYNTNTQTNEILKYPLSYRINYRRTLWLGKPKQTGQRPRTMGDPWKKLRPPDRIFWPPECRDRSIKILIATADLDRRLKRKRRIELSGGE